MRTHPLTLKRIRIEVQDRADRAIFVGNVRVKPREACHLDAARLTVAYVGGALEIAARKFSGLTHQVA